jgi:hypothetical protein
MNGVNFEKHEKGWMICEGDHSKAEGCTFKLFVPEQQVADLEARLAEKNAYIVECENSIRFWKAQCPAQPKSPASIILAEQGTLVDPDKALVSRDFFKAAVEMAKGVEHE